MGSLADLRCHPPNDRLHWGDRSRDRRRVLGIRGGELVTLLLGLVMYLTLAAPSGLNFDDVLPLLTWGTVLGGGMGYTSVSMARRALPDPERTGPELGTPRTPHARERETV